MLFQNFDYRSHQILEGFDKIKVMLQPYLYSFLSLEPGKQIDPLNKVHILPTKAEFFTNDSPYPHYKHYFYLNIHGEFIDHDRNMKWNIAKAIHLLIEKEVLQFKMVSAEHIPWQLIYDNLHLFIRGISEIEFCFDFRPEDVRILDSANIIDTANSELFDKLKKTPIKKREKTLIRLYQNQSATFYSYDYTSHRDSTLILYNRSESLLHPKGFIHGNTYPNHVIMENPYKYRIEFRLKAENSRKVLAVGNLNGNYSSVVNYYSEYLARRFHVFFYDLISVNVNPEEHPFFSRIYDEAKEDRERCTGDELDSRDDEHKLYYGISDPERFNRLNDLLKNAKRQHKSSKADIEQSYTPPGFKILKLPDSMFMGLNNLNNIRVYTPQDYQDESNIEWQDEDTTLFKDQQYYFPPFNNEDDNDDK
jgi:hypothetical protein